MGVGPVNQFNNNGCSLFQMTVLASESSNAFLPNLSFHGL